MSESNKIEISWSTLIDDFNEIAIQTKGSREREEYEIARLSEKYGISRDALHEIYNLHRGHQEREQLSIRLLVLNSPPMKQLLAAAGGTLSWLNRQLDTMEIIPFIEKIAKLGIIVAAGMFIFELPDRLGERESQRRRAQFSAWQVVTRKPEQSETSRQVSMNNGISSATSFCNPLMPSAGRKEALRYLIDNRLDVTGLDLDHSALEEMNAGKRPTPGSSLMQQIRALRRKGPRLLWPQYVQERDVTRPRLNSVDFSCSSLIWANFRHAELVHSDFDNANLREADFRHANLSRADFRNAYLANARFDGADLRCTNLRTARELDTEILSKPRIIEGAIGSTLAYALLPKALIENLEDEMKTRVNSFEEGEAKRMFEELSEEKDIRSHGNTSNSINQILQEYSATHRPSDIPMNSSFACEDLRGLDFRRIQSFEGASFAYAQLENLDLSNKSLKKAIFTDAYIAGTRFNGSDISGAHFESAKNLHPEQFTKALNWRKAIFFEDDIKDLQFKRKIEKAALKSRQTKQIPPFHKKS